ncbi:MAG: hypothetical protein V3V08_06770 [Nannocystaceae bacterium]
MLKTDTGESGLSAIIDIGSNSCLLLIARRLPGGSLDVRLDRSTVTRLSQGAAQTGTLRADAVARTLSCLKQYAEIAREHGARPRAVATEGLRMVTNPEVFLEPAAAILGDPVQLISGDEEARLSYLSVALEYDEARDLRVLDIGGGSTELVVGHGHEVRSSMSHAVGSVRLTEAHVHQDPPSAASVAAMEAAVRAAFARQPLSPFPQLHGLAGTITSSAALILELPRYERSRVDQATFGAAAIRKLRDRLMHETLLDRSAYPSLGQGRADVIVAGVTILLVALEHCGAETLVVRDRGLRYALLPCHAEVSES